MRQLAVIMFTDVEGFTAILQEDELRGKEIHDFHRTSVSHTVARHTGQLIQFYGDGSLSLFWSPLEAVQCAIELQRQFRGGHQIPVRIGMHLGEVLITDENVFGTAVNIASRIESLAVSGSILISEKVFLEIANQPEIKTVFFGIYHFKHVRRPIRIYAIENPILNVPRQAHQDAKLATNVFQSNLPRFSDDFIGRKKLRQKLAQVIQNHPNTVISILGVGGLGKTRLAIQVAQENQDQFPHGVCFVALDKLQESTSVPMAIGTALGLREHAEMDWLECIRDYLMDRQVLLILDNMEHVLDCAPNIDSLVVSCPLLTILCTSRRSLDLSREIEFPLEVMNSPPNHYHERNVENDCIRLFENRARKVKPNFQVNQRNYEDIAEICQNLDGIPLAIELAAARTKMLSPKDIKSQLNNLFRILRNSKLQNRRHQAIFETIKWSFDLLSEAEREVLLGLSVIPGNISMDYIETLSPSLDAFEMVEQLFNHSLIYRASDTHELHYRMLSVVRRFGQALLQEQQLLKSRRKTFSKYLVDQLSNYYDKKESSKRDFDKFLDDSFDNIRLAIDFWMKEDSNIGADLFLKTWRYFLRRGLIREAQEKVLFFMANGGTVQQKLADLQVAYGTLSHNLGQYLQSRDAFSSALRYFVGTQATEETIITLNHLSWAEFRLGHYEKANSYAEHALDQAHQFGDQRHVCRALNNLAWVHHFRGQLSEAHEIQSKLIERYTELSDRYGIAFSLTNCTWIAVEMGQTDHALSTLEKAIQIFHDLKNRQMFAFSHLVTGIALQELGSWHEAQDKINSICLPIFTDIGDSWGLALALQKLAEIVLAQENYLQADELIGKSLEIRTHNHDRWGMAACHTVKAEYHLIRDDPFEARRHVEIALPKAEEMGCQNLLIRLYGIKARIYWHNKNPHETAVHLDKALKLLDIKYQREKFIRKFHDLFSELDKLKISLSHR